MRSLIPLLFIGAWCLCGCGGMTDHTLRVSDVVRPRKATGDLSIPGTKLFLHDYSGLVLDSARQTLYKDSSISLKILYYAGASNDDSVDYFHRDLERALDNDSGIFYRVRDFQMDSCPARIYYRKSAFPGKDEIALFFDDNTFSAGALALFPSGRPETRDSLLKTMLSLYVYDNPGEVEAIEPFTMDLSHSEFKYCNRIGQAFFYTIGGKSNPSYIATQDQFFVARMPPKSGVALRERTTAILDMYTRAGLRIPKYSIERTFIRASEAYELEGDFQLGNKSGKLYVVAMGDALHPLALSALLYENIDRRLNEMIYIAHSLQLKEMVTR